MLAQDQLQVQAQVGKKCCGRVQSEILSETSPSPACPVSGSVTVYPGQGGQPKEGWHKGWQCSQGPPAAPRKPVMAAMSSGVMLLIMLLAACIISGVNIPPPCCPHSPQLIPSTLPTPFPCCRTTGASACYDCKSALLTARQSVMQWAREYTTNIRTTAVTSMITAVTAVMTAQKGCPGR